MKATICPVCNGSGKYQVPNPYSSTGPEFVTCHGCGGKGWVEVNETQPTFVPYRFYPITYPCPPVWPEWPGWPSITYGNGDQIGVGQIAVRAQTAALHPDALVGGINQ